MQDPKRSLFADDALPKDELDNLFEKLQQIEPPPSLVARILTSISQLPQYLPSVPSVLWDKLDGMVVRNDEREPS